MKTTVIVRVDGTFILDAVNRVEAARRMLANFRNA